ncbi:hypothetical protein [Bailinhaonella thermotolerans]|uniref:hypothetical protein n=1 Tax=Bailinhaonella thermotolerans TaxID=1070861 RepID=UPI0011C3CF97|nr:hypothetical protein [Bailinhaonella thermotolerans]
MGLFPVVGADRHPGGADLALLGRGNLMEWCGLSYRADAAAWDADVTEGTAEDEEPEEDRPRVRLNGNWAVTCRRF